MRIAKNASSGLNPSTVNTLEKWHPHLRSSERAQHPRNRAAPTFWATKAWKIHPTNTPRRGNWSSWFRNHFNTKAQFCLKLAINCHSTAPPNMNLQATLEAEFYMDIYFNAFKQRSALKSCHKARKNKTEVLKLVGIVLVLGLYWYCWFRLLYCIGIGIGGKRPVLFICGCWGIPLLIFWCRPPWEVVFIWSLLTPCFI